MGHGANVLGSQGPPGFESLPLRNPSLKLRICSEAIRRKTTGMYYTYILLSSKSHIFYFGSTNNLKERLLLHNSEKAISTKPHTPWRLVWYCAFETEKQARDFELYLKTGSGKSFAYKRLISVALARDFENGRIGRPKP